MNKSELVSALAEKTDNSQAKIKSILTELDAIITNNAVGGADTVIGSLTIKVEPRTARVGRNPKTGEAIDVPAKNVIKVTVGKALKDAINK